MATDAEKVKMYREKAKDATIPQEVRNTYLDRANELERKAYEATKVPEKKMAKGGVAMPAPTTTYKAKTPVAKTPVAKTPVAKTPTVRATSKSNPLISYAPPPPVGAVYAKGGMAKKTPAKGKPVVAIMVGMAKPKGKTMMNKGGMAKKGKC